MKQKSTSLAFHCSSPLDNALTWNELVGTMPYRLVCEEETLMDYLYKVDMLPEEDERDALTAKVRLPRNHKARVSGATASANHDGVITVRVPKRDLPQKWYEEIGFRFETICIKISKSY
ncbi:hypothetical protein NL676_029025 [Syzygium grande]|nr:hypothetical protein NL676_029025 [Syzygium grande]